MPERFSRLTKFSLSISFCKILNLGSTTARETKISPRNTTTAKATKKLRDTLFCTAKITPPMPMIGV